MRQRTTYTLAVFAALALTVGGRSGLAATPGTPHGKIIPMAVTDDTSASTTGALMGIIALGTYPPLDSSGNDEWPCFTGGTDPDCSSIPVGGVVIGIPYQEWSATTCNSGACAQVFWSFSSLAVSGTVIVSETITQGNNTIYQSGSTNLGAGTAPFLSFVWDEIGTGPGACSGCVAAVKGAARVTTTATIGSTTLTGHTTVYME